jgi:hypothetical protein
MIRIFYRACDKVNAINGFPRPMGLSKFDLIKLCFESVKRNLKFVNYHMTLILDNCTPEMTSYFEDFVHDNFDRANIIETNLGGEGSAKLQFKLAKDVGDDDIVYFLEDDYLHTFDQSIQAMAHFIGHHKVTWIHPTDYPDRYTRSEDISRRWQIAITDYAHWREIANTTLTFMCPAKRLKTHLDFFIECGLDDGKLSNLFRGDEVLFSPIPTLAIHMHEGTLPYRTMEFKK